MAVFTRLCAFPPTPANADGVVDVDRFGMLVDRLAQARVDSVSVLGSTGGYAYLDRAQRNRAVAAAVEVASGRLPVVVGIGALRTSWACELAVAAEALGASGVLLAPMSYTKLSDDEVEAHFRTIASTTSLPLCIYNNPGTTNFTFSPALIARLARQPNIAAVKMPPPDCDAYAAEIAALRSATPQGFKVGYSGDWGAAKALIAGADAWHSVIAGILPAPARRLARAVQERDLDQIAAIEAAFAPLWALFLQHGSLRLIYEIAELLGLKIGDAPLPIQRCGAKVRGALEVALARLDSGDSPIARP